MNNGSNYSVWEIAPSYDPSLSFRVSVEQDQLNNITKDGYYVVVARID